MSEKNCNNSAKEGTSKKRFFAFERGPWGTLKTHGKKKLFFILLVFQKGFLKTLRFWGRPSVDFSSLRPEIDSRNMFLHFYTSSAFLGLCISKLELGRRKLQKYHFQGFSRLFNPSSKSNRQTECIFRISEQNGVEWHVFQLHLTKEMWQFCGFGAHEIRRRNYLQEN